MILFHLPLPPSTNSLYRNKSRGRVKTQRYLTWIRAAKNDVMAQRMGQTGIPGNIKIQLTCGRPDHRRRDITNLIKAPEDLMVSMGLIDDDHLTDDAWAHWGDIRGCEMRIYAADEVEFRAVNLVREAAT